MTDMLTPNEVLIMRTPDWADLPKPDVPYFVITAEGFYLRKNTLFGEATVPFKGIPESLIKPGTKGRFEQNDLRFPGWLVLQVTDFFTKVYTRHHSEAAVIVTYNPRLKRFRVFVPEQYVSGGGVHQRYDPEHLEEGWYAIGTIHSHCNFGAGHSGVDTHDADDMDGMHMTIGMLLSPNGPQVATMIAMNKSLFHIKFEEACDIKDAGTEHDRTAPEWWFRYLRFNQRAPWLKPETNFKPVQTTIPFATNVRPKKSEPVKGDIIAQNAKGETLIIPRELPEGYKDWSDWWRINGGHRQESRPQKKSRPVEAGPWRTRNWTAWWTRILASGQIEDDVKSETTEESPMGPFENNAQTIREADRQLAETDRFLKEAGFELSYSIIWRGNKPQEEEN